MNKKENKKEADWSKHGGSDVHAFEWIGAILVCLFKLGRVSSNEIAKPENSKRNIIVGNLFCLVLFVLFIIMLLNF